MLLWGCGWGISLVFAFPQVITLYLISGKRLVYFGNLAILPKCLWKGGNVHLGFVFLNLVKPHLALYEQLQNASIVIKCKIHVLVRKLLLPLRSFNSWKEGFFIFPKLTGKLNMNFNSLLLLSCHSWKSEKRKVWLQTKVYFFFTAVCCCGVGI